MLKAMIELISDWNQSTYFFLASSKCACTRLCCGEEMLREALGGYTFRFDLFGVFLSAGVPG